MYTNKLNNLFLDGKVQYNQSRHGNGCDTVRSASESFDASFTTVS